MPVPVDPGQRTLQATAPRKKTYTVTVDVPAAGETVTVEIPALEAEPIVLTAGPPATIAATPAPPPGPSLAVLPVVAAGAVGLAGAATAIVFGLETLSVNDDAKKLCPTNVCSQAEKDQHDRLVSDARRDRAISYVGIAVAGVGLATAAVLWWRPGPLRPRATTTVTGAVLPGGLAAAAEIRW